VNRDLQRHNIRHCARDLIHEKRPNMKRDQICVKRDLQRHNIRRCARDEPPPPNQKTSPAIYMKTLEKRPNMYKKTPTKDTTTCIVLRMEYVYIYIYICINIHICIYIYTHMYMTPTNQKIW